MHRLADATGSHRLRRTTTLVCLLGLIGFTSGRADDSKAHRSFPEQVKRVVFCLQHQHTLAVTGGLSRTDWIGDGTAFMVQYQGHRFLVTARHVAELPYALSARVFVNADDRGSVGPLELRIPREAWSFHPDGPNPHLNSAGVDIAVAAVPDVRNPEVGALAWCDDCPGDQVNQVCREDPSPAAPAVVVGCPGNLGQGWLGGVSQLTFRSASVLLVGNGTVSIPLDSGAIADRRVFLLDRRAQPGNSGSAVFRAGEKLELMGLAIAVNQDWDFTVVEPAYQIVAAMKNALHAPKAATANWQVPPPPSR